MKANKISSPTAAAIFSFMNTTSLKNIWHKVLVCGVVLFIHMQVSAQTLVDFEGLAVDAAAFTSNSLNFTTTESSQFDVFVSSSLGWNGTAVDNNFIDNDASVGNKIHGSLNSASNIVVKSLWVYAGDNAANNTVISSGSLIIRGKLSSATQFTITKSTGFNTATPSVGTQNGFTLINFATEGGSDNSNTTIDELEFETTGDITYIAIDGFTWDNPNATPALTLTGGNFAYTENATAVQIDPAATLTDADNNWNSGTLVAQISAGSEAADELAIGNIGPITLSGLNVQASAVTIGTTSAASVTGNTSMTITFNGTATSANVQDVIRALTYRSTSETPSTTTRTVSLTATDDASASSGVQTRNGTVTALNDPPTLTATGSNPTFTEDAAAASLFTTASASTVEGSQTITAMTITVTNVSDGSTTGQDEVINIDGTAISLEDTNVGSTSNFSGYSTSHSAGTTTISLTGGTVVPATISTIINGMTYQNNSNTPSTGSARVVTVTSLTDSGPNGSGNVNVNSGPSIISSSVTVAASNDPPTLTATGQNPSFTIGGGGVSLYNTTNVNSIEAQNIIGLIFTVTNVVDGAPVGADERIIFDGSSIPLNNGSSGTTTGGNSVMWNVGLSGGTATVAFSSFSITEATFEGLVNGMQYQNVNGSATTGNRVVTMTTVQDAGGTSPGNDTNSGLSIVSTVNVVAAATNPEIDNVRWLDANPVDGNIDQVQLTFNQAVDFTDTDGAGGTGLDIFSGITFDNTPNYAGASFQNVTVVTLNLATPIAGTALPSNTLTYTTSGGSNATIVNNGGALQVNNGEISTHGGTYTDGAAPRAINRTTVDNDNNGTADFIRVQFSESVVDATVAAADFVTSLAGSNPAGDGAFLVESFASGTPGTGNQTDVANDNTIFVGIANGSETIMAGTTNYTTQLAITGTINDGASNSSVAESVYTSSTDGMPPAVTARATVDNDNDGTIDYIRITFSEPMNDASIAASDFVASIAGTNPATDGGFLTELFTSGTPSSGNQTDTPNDNIIFINVANGTETITADKTDYQLLVAITGTVNDANGNALPTESSFTTSTDAAVPRPTGGTTVDNDNNGTADFVRLTFTEPINDGSVAASDFVMSLAGSSPAGDGGFLVESFTSGVPASGNQTDTGNDNTLFIGIANGTETINAGVTNYAVRVAITGSIADPTGNTLGGQTSYSNSADGMPPSITSRVTVDNNGDGTVDFIRITFSEPMADASISSTDFVTSIAGTNPATDGSFLNETFSSGTPSSGNQTDTGNDNIIFIGVTSGTETITGNKTDYQLRIAITGTINDPNGNIFPAEAVFTASTDGASPRVVSGTTVDNDANGTADFIRLVFTEPINDGSVAASDFVTSLAGSSPAGDGGFLIESFASGTPGTGTETDTPNDNTLFIGVANGTETINSGVTNYQIQLAVTGSIADPAGNTFGGATTYSATSDGMVPLVTARATVDNDANGTVDFIRITFSEPMNDATISAADFVTSIAGTNPATDGGFLVESFASGTPSSGNQTDTGNDNVIFVGVANGTETISANKTDYTLLVAITGAMSDANANALATESSFTASTDGAAPAPVSSTTVDNDNNGTADFIKFVVSEPLNDASIAASDFVTSIGGSTPAGDGGLLIESFTSGVPGTGNETDTGNDNTFFIGVASGTETIVAGTTNYTLQFALTGSVADPAGNTIGGVTTYTSSSDGMSPLLNTRETVDNNNDGTVDFIKLTFSEAIADATVAPADFVASIAGSTPAGDGGLLLEAFSPGTPGSGNETDTGNDNVIFVAVASGTETISANKTDYGLLIAVTGSVDDAAGNSFGGESSYTTSTDRAAPRVFESQTLDNDNNGTVDFVKLTFSEGISDASVAASDFTVSIAGSTPSGDGGLLIESFTSGTPGSGNETDTGNDNIIFVGVASGTETIAANKTDYALLGAITGVVSDPNGNNFGGETSYGASTDGARPTVAITRQTPTVANTIAPTVVLRATFSETVSNVDAADFDVTNGSITGENLSGVNPVSGSIYDITVNSYTGTGTVNLDFAGGQNIADGIPNNFNPGVGITSEQEFTIVAPSANSDIVEQSGFSFTSSINPVTFNATNIDLTSAGDEVQVAGFTLRDGGGAADVDDASTIITSLQVDVTSGASSINRIALYSGSGTELGEGTLTAGSITFGSLSITAADNGSENFSIYVTFRTDGNAVDNDVINVAISQANVSTGASSSTLSAFGTVNTSETGAENQIEVTATALNIASIDTSIGISTNFNATVEGVDTNGNRDLDFTENITASIETENAPGVPAISGNGPIAAVSGLATFSALQVDGGGTYTFRFTAAPSAFFVISGNVEATSNASDIIEDTGFNYPEYIAYTSYTESTITFGGSTSLVVAQFIIRDGGAGNESDNKVTRVTGISFSLNAAAQADVAELALFTSGGTQLGTEQAAGATVTFNGFTFDVGDTNDETIVLKATFNQTTAITDGDQLTFTVSNIQDDTGSNRSGFTTNTPAGVTTSNPQPGDNTIDVVADRLAFTANNPSSTQFERLTGNLNFTVAAQDAIGNTDTNETSQLSIGGATGLNVSTFNLTSGTANPTITIDTEVENATLTIADNNGNTGSRTGTTTITNNLTATLVDIHDTTAPTINSFSTDLSPADNATNVALGTTLTMTFSENVSVGTDFVTVVRNAIPPDVFQLSVTDNSKVSVTNNVVTLTLPTPLKGSSSYYVLASNGTFTDAPNNTNAVGAGPINYTSQFTTVSDWNFSTVADTDPPTLTITRNAVTNGSFTNTNDNSVSWALAFSEEIDETTFTIADVAVNATGVTHDALTAGSLVNSGDDRNFTLTVSNVAGDGTLSITVGPNINDAVTPANTMAGAVGPSDTFTFDNTAPTAPNVTIVSNNTTTNTRAITGNTVTLTLDFDDNLSSNPTVAFRSNGATINNSITVTETDAVNDIWTATYNVNSLDLEGTVSFVVDFTDDAGNAGSSVTAVAGTGAGTTVIVDNTAPTVTIARDAVTLGSFAGTTDAAVSYTITFNEQVTAFTVADDIATSSTGLTLGTVTLNSASNPTHTLNYNATITGDGNLSFNLNHAGASPITDLAGNAMTASTASDVITIDNTVPAITSINRETPSSTTTNANSVTFRVTFNNPINASTLASGDFTLSGTAIAGASVGTVTEDVTGLQFLVVVNSISGDGTLRLDYTGSIDDPAGNTYNTVFNTGQEYTIDNTAPTIPNVTLSSNNVTNTNRAITGNTVTLEMDFDDNLTGSPTIQLRSNGATVQNTVTVTETDAVNDIWRATYNVSNLDLEGAVTFVIDFTDDAGNAGSSVTAVAGTGAGTSVTVDNTAPTVTITRDAVSPGSFASTTDDAVSYTITFSEAITAFTVADDIATSSTGLTLGTTTISTGDNITHTLNYNATITGNGNLSFNLNHAGASPITDLAGNAMTASTASDAITFDNTTPAITSINRETPSGAVTNANSVTFRVTFNDAINAATLTNADFTLSGTAIAGASIGTVTESVTGLQYLVQVNSISGDGTLRLDYTGTINDAAGNAYSTVFNTGQEYTIDNTVPTAPNVTIASNNVTNTNRGIAGNVVTLTLDFDDNLTGSPTVQFSSGGASVQGSVTVTETDAVNDIWTATYTVNTNDTDGNVTFVVNFTDDGGNAGASVTAVAGTGAATSVLIDKVAPTVTITRDAVSPGSFASTTDDAVSYTITFSEAITAFTVADDIATSSTGLTLGTTTLTTGDNITHTLNYNATITGNGNLSFNLNHAGASPITDLAGNAMTASTASDAITFDNTTPAITSINRETPSGAITNANSVTFRVTFNDAINTATLTNADFTLSGTAIAGASIGTVTESVTGLQYLVQVNSISGDGTLRLDYTGTINDAAGNAYSTVFNTGQEYTIDNTAPTAPNVTIASNNVTNTNRGIAGNVVTLTLDFDDNLTGSPTVQFSSGGASVQGSVTVTETDAVNDIWTATYTVNTNDTDGNVTFVVNFTDDGGNAGASVTAVAGTGAATSVLIDKVAPTVTITRDAVSPGSFASTTDDAVSYTITFSEAITAFTVADDIATSSTGLTLGTTTLTTGDNITHTLNYNATINGNGNLSFNLNHAGASPITDLAGNAMAASTASDAITFDNTTPAITSINRETPSGAITNANSVTFRVTFNDAINTATLTNADFTLAGTAIAGASIGTVTESVTGLQYLVQVNSISGDGTLRLDYTGTINDAAGNAYSTVFNTGQEYTIDNTAPTAPNVTIASNNVTNTNRGIAGNTVTLTLDFDDNLTGSPTVQFSSGGATVQGSVTVTETDAVNDIWTATYTVNTNDTDGNVTFVVNFTDDGGNAGSSVTAVNGTGAGTSVLIDKVAPTVTITRDAVSPGSFASTTDNAVSYTITFSEAITAFTVADDIATSSTGLTLGTTTLTTGDNITHTLNYNATITGNGNLSFNLNHAGASPITDLAGNAMAASTASDAITFDNTTPAITSINRETPSSATTNANTVNFRVIFNDAINAATLTSGDFTLFGTAIAGASVGTITQAVTGTEFLVAVNTVSGNGTLRLDFTGSINDAAGNTYNTTFNSGQVYTIDNIAPTAPNVTIVSNNSTSTSHAIGGNTVTLTIDFDDNLTGSPTIQMRSGGATVQNTVTVTEINAVNDIWTATYSVNNLDVDGAVTFVVDFTDDAGNAGSSVTAVAGTGAGTSVAVDKAVPILSTVGLQTNNSTNNSFGVNGNTVSLTFTANDALSATPTVTMRSGGNAVNNAVSVNTAGAPTYVATYTIDGTNDTDGNVTFTIDFVDDAGNVGTQVTSVTNGSSVTVDTTPPGFTSSSAPAGTGIVTVTVNLTENGTSYYIIQPDGTAAPTSAQVRAGQDGTGGTPTASGSITVNNTSSNFTSNETLSTSTVFDVYIVNQDFLNNLSATPTLLNNVMTKPVGPTVAEITTNTATGDSNGAIAMYTGSTVTSVGATNITPITITPTLASNTIRIYTNAAHSAQVSGTGLVGSASYTPNLSNFDLTATSYGVHTFYVTETTTAASNTSEGDHKIYSISIANPTNSAGLTVFSEDNTSGTTLSLTHPTAHTVDFVGNGLANKTINVGGTSSARFVPVAAGSGGSPHTITMSMKNATNVEATYQVQFIVNQTTSVFDNSQTKAFCVDAGVSSLVINNPDGNNANNSANNANNGTPDFYDLQFFAYKNGSRSTDVTSTVKTSGTVTTIVAGAGNNTGIDVTNWGFNPQLYTLGDGGIDTLDVVIRTIDETTDAISELANQLVIIYPLPTVQINNVGISETSDFFCEKNDSFSDVSFTVTYTVNSGNSINATAYTIQALTGTNTGANKASSAIGSGLGGTLNMATILADPVVGLQTGETQKQYRITITSATTNDPNTSQGSPGCTNTATATFTVFKNPGKPGLTFGATSRGFDQSGGNANNYLFEYCQGETPENLVSTGGSSTRWYLDNGAGGKGTEVTTGNPNNLPPFDLFGTATPNATNQTFHYTQTTNSQTNGGGTKFFNGCQSDISDVRIQVHSLPGTPAIDLTSSTSGQLLSTANTYAYEYCAGSTVEDVIINTATSGAVTNGSTFYEWFSSNGSTFDGLTGSFTTSNADPNDAANDPNDKINIAGNVRATFAELNEGNPQNDFTYKFTIKKRENRNTTTNKFDGCVSPTPATVNVVVYSIPSAPPTSGFTTDINACSGELSENTRIQVSDKVNTPGTDNVVYNWWANSGLTQQIGQVDGNNANSELTYNQIFSNANVAGLNSTTDTDAANQYYTVSSTFNKKIYLTQTTNLTNRMTTIFQGCRSTTGTEVDMTIYPLDAKPTLKGPIAAHAGGVNEQLNFQAGVLSESSLFNLTTSFTETATLKQDFNWYFSNASFTKINRVTVANDNNANALELLLTANSDLTSYFVASQTTNIEFNGATKVFNGCESDTTKLRVNIFNIPSEPVESTGNEQFYHCFGDNLTTSIAHDYNGENGISAFYLYSKAADVGDATKRVTLTIDPSDGTKDIGKVTFADLQNADTNGGETPISSTTPGTYRYFITQVSDINTGANPAFGGSESAAADLEIIILPQPQDPILSSLSAVCSVDPIPTVVITNRESGDEFLWYDVTGKNPLSDAAISTTTSGAPDFTPTSAQLSSSNTTTSFFVFRRENRNIDGRGFAGCASGQVTANVTIFPEPGAPAVTGNVSQNRYEFCEGSDVSSTNLTVNNSQTGVVYTWYSSSNLTTANRITTGASVPFTQIAGNPNVNLDINTPTAIAVPIFVTQTTDATCESNAVQVEIFINALPTPNITGVLATDNTVCVDAGLQALTADIAGGTFSGTGVVGTNFDPLIGSGNANATDLKANVTRRVTYTVTDAKGCTNNTSTTGILDVTVNPLPFPDFNFDRQGVGTANNEYCIDATNLQLSATLTNGTTVFAIAGTNGSTDGLVDNGNGSGSINFTNAFNGDNQAGGTQTTHNITYTFTDATNSCTNSITKQVKVNQLPTVTLTAPQAAYCIDASAVTLTGTTVTTGTTGVFSGAFTTDNNNGTGLFNPSIEAAKGGSTDPGAVATNHTITYTFTDTNGCVNSANLDLTVNRLPTVDFSFSSGQNPTATNEYCVDASNAALQGIGAGNNATSGSFVINTAGLVNNNGNGTVEFNPATAHANASGATVGGSSTNHNVTYTFTDGNSCVNSISKTLVVNPKPSLEFSGEFALGTIDGTSGGGRFTNANAVAMCVTEEQFSISNNVQGGTYTFNNAPLASAGGVANFNAGTYENDIAGLQSNTFTLKLDYTDDVGCVNSVENQITIHNQPVVVIGRDGGCTDEPVQFTAAVSTPFTNSDISNYTWGFSGTETTQTGVNASHQYELGGNLFSNVFTNLTGTTSFGCVSRTERLNFTVGASPEPAFFWDSVTVNRPTAFWTNEVIIPSTNIDTIYLDPGDGSGTVFIARPNNNTALNYGTRQINGDNQVTFDAFDEIRHTYTGTGLFDATVRFISTNGCVGVAMRKVNVIPLITVTGSYLQDFEGAFNADAEGWYPERLSANAINEFPPTERDHSWRFGIPQGTNVNVAASGTNAWSTTAKQGGTYATEEQSWLYSPTFDFSSLQRPMVRFNSAYNFDIARDGVVLQYSTNNGVSWHALGTFDDAAGSSTGVEWYTSSNVQADPGVQTSRINDNAVAATGWAGPTTNSARWVSSRHKLDEIPVAERSAVRFRFSIGSQTVNPTSDGFAFDDFEILERSKNVVTEVFTTLVNKNNNGPTLLGLVQTAINDATINNGDALLINYHTDLDNGQFNDQLDVDPFNAVNTSDPNARVLFYGANQVGSVLDGNVQSLGNTFDQQTGDVQLPWSSSDLSRSSLDDPLFDVRMSNLSLTTEDLLSVEVQFVANGNVALNDPDLQGGEFRAYVAVVEDNATQGSSNSTNVVRKLLPSGTGQFIELGRDLTTGEILPLDKNDEANNTLSVSWQLKNVGVNSNITIIAFIQNENSKEIYQSTSMTLTTDGNIVTGLGDGLTDEGYKLYPNPASEEVFIVFEQQIIETLQWYIFDQSGRMFERGEIAPGTEGISVDTRMYPSGLYFLSIHGENTDLKNRKIMIQH